MLSGSAYSIGVEGHLVTQALVEASLYSLAVALQVGEHFLVVGSANSPTWHDETHSLVDKSP